MIFLTALVYLFSGPNSLGEMGYLIDAEIVNDQLIILDQLEARLLVFPLISDSGTLQLGPMKIVGRKGQGPGEFDHPEVIIPNPSGFWVGSRLVPKVQLLSNETFEYQTALWYPFGKPIEVLPNHEILIMHPEFDEDGYGMYHVFNPEKGTWDDTQDYVDVSKETTLNNGAIGDHLTAYDAQNVYYGDPLNLRIEKWRKGGKRVLAFQQDWAGLTPWEGSRRFDGKPLREFRSTISTFRNAGCFLFTEKDQQYLVTTIERPNDRNPYVVQVFNTDSGKLVSRFDGESFPIAVYHQFFIMAPTAESDEVTFTPFKNVFGGML